MGKDLSEQEIIRRNKLFKLIKNGKNPFVVSKFKRTHTSVEFKHDFIKYSKEELCNMSENLIIIKIAGRIMSFRSSGKATFATLQDQSGNFQIYIQQKNLVDNSLYNDFLNLDLGDIIGVTGAVMKTNTGELTVRVNSYELLCKSLKVLPSKYYGMNNVEEKYRRRYVDLIMSSETKSVFIKRSKIISLIRSYFDSKGYLEVETPVLQPIHGGANARPFITYHNTLDMNFYLRVATELPLKKLIVGGFDGVYEIGRVFRNEGVDTIHNPEFTSVEVYVAYQDMYFMMDLTENVICYVLKKIFKNNEIIYNEKKIIFKRPWKRIHIVDAIKENTGINFWKKMTFEECKNIAENMDVSIKEFHNGVGHIIMSFFEKFVESTLIQPTFIYGYPTEVSPLAKLNADDVRFTDRFELFIDGKEYANAYSELNNPIEQLERFKKHFAEKKNGNDEANEVDFSFIEALEYGMPPTGGLGIGIDRLVMLCTGKNSIKDVLLFPHMRSK